MLAVKQVSRVFFPESVDYDARFRLECRIPPDLLTGISLSSKFLQTAKLGLVPCVLLCGPASRRDLLCDVDRRLLKSYRAP